jgi:hypothetical protein
MAQAHPERFEGSWSDLDVPLDNIKHVAEVLVQFNALSPEEQDNARSSVIEKIFPLVLGDNAAVEGSPSFSQLKVKPW